jgi:hypothetical protein
MHVLRQEKTIHMGHAANAKPTFFPDAHNHILKISAVFFDAYGVRAYTLSDSIPILYLG